MTTASPVIAAESLIKRFGRFTALNGLDLTVEAGEVHGFLGPNGSGKSTTIRVLRGLLRTDGGHVALFGADLFEGQPTEGDADPRTKRRHAVHGGTGGARRFALVGCGGIEASTPSPHLQSKRLALAGR